MSFNGKRPNMGERSDRRLDATDRVWDCFAALRSSLAVLPSAILKSDHPAESKHRHVSVDTDSKRS
jgi:hypothetical protein